MPRAVRLFAASAVSFVIVFAASRAVAQTPTPSPAPAPPGMPPRMMAGQGQPKGTAVVRGTVVAVDTGAPLRRVQVRASALSGEDNRSATSDDQGRFEIRDLVGGRYTISAQKSGYVMLAYGQRRPNERGTPVEVPPGQTVDKITLALPRGGVITGHIADEAGEPLAEVMVRVQRYRYTPAGRQLVPMGRGDTTDDQGSFRLYGLEPGEYVVSATLRNVGAVIVNGRPEASSDQGYAPTYYPGTPAAADAQRVVVNAGQEVSGVSFALTPTRVSRLSGRVTGAVGALSEGFVSMRTDDGSIGGMMPGGMVQSDGTFVIVGVPPGRYSLNVQPRLPDGQQLIGQARITVAGADVENIVIPLRPQGTLSGRIEFEGGTPADVTPAMVRVSPMPSTPSMGAFMMSGPPQTGPDYSFTMRGAMGPVYIRAGGAPGWYLKSVHIGGEDVTDTPVPFEAGADIRDVRVVLTRTVTTVAGTVRDDRGNPVVDATLVIFPEDDSRWTMGSRHMRTLRPDTQGRFETRGLPPASNYRIVAVQGLEDGQAYDPEFLTSVRDRAERLALAPGESKTMNIRLR